MRAPPSGRGIRRRIGRPEQDGSQVGFAFQFAQHDQIAAPDLKSESLLNGFVVVIDPQRQDKVGLLFPGDFKFDRRPVGKSDVAENRPFLSGRQVPKFFVPGAGRHGLPTRQALRTQVDDVGTVAPAKEAVYTRPLDMHPADVGDVELQLFFVLSDEGAVQDVAAFQFEAIIAAGPGRPGERRKMHGVHVVQGKLERLCKRG